MTSIRDIIKLRVELDQTQADKLADERLNLVAVDYTTSTKVKGRPGYKWAANANNPANIFQIYAPKVKDRSGLPVRANKVRKPPFYRRMAAELDWNRLTQEDIADLGLDGVYPHATSHQWPENLPGDDALSIYPRAIVPLSLRLSSGLYVYISPGIYRYRGKSIKFAGQLVALSGYLPAAGNVVRLSLYIDPLTNTPGVESTSEYPVIQSPPYDLVTKNVLYVGWVKLSSDTTAVVETIINEPRAFMAVDASNIQTITGDAQAAALLAEAVDGDAFWATDTETLYIHNGAANIPVANSAAGVYGGVLKGQVFG